MAGEIITVGTLITSVRISREDVSRSDAKHDAFAAPDGQRHFIDVVSLSPRALALARNGGPAGPSAMPDQPETEDGRNQQQSQNLPERLLDICV